MVTRIFICLVFISCLILQEVISIFGVGLEKDMNSEVQKVKEINEPDAIEADTENQADIVQLSSPKDNTEEGDENFVAPISLDANEPETLRIDNSEAIQKSTESIFNHQDLRGPEIKVEQSESGNKLEKTEADGKVELSETESKLDISETESKLDIPETDSKVGISETESKLDISEIDSKVEISETESKPDISETESKVGISETESKVGISETESKLDISETDSKVGISETESNIVISDTVSKGELNETDCKSKSEKSPTETLADQPEECTLLNSGQAKIVLVRAEEESEAKTFDDEIEDVEMTDDDKQIEDVEMIDDDSQIEDKESTVEEGSNNRGQDKETVIESGQLITNKVTEALAESPLETLPSNPEETLPNSCTPETLEILEEETTGDMGQCVAKDHKEGQCSDETSDEMLKTGSGKKMEVADGDNKRKKQTTLAGHGFEPRKNEAKAGKKKKRDDKEDITVGNRPTNRDTEQYRRGYPGKKDDPKLNANKEFYFGEIKSEPDGAFIDEIHQEWFGNYELLEQHHGYIQWIFPIREDGMNWRAQPLQPHEAKAIMDDPTAKKRVLKSYHMMLDFYGMELDEQGKIKRSKNYRRRFQNLTNHTHNYLRITRILKSLGELGYENLKKPFLEFILKEALLRDRLLKSTLSSCKNYWIGTLKSDEERESLYQFIDEHENGVS